jgi:SAM-dependent methyltransferase
MDIIRPFLRQLNTKRDQVYDWYHKVDTWQQIDLHQLEITSENLEHGVRYVPTTQFRFRRIINNFPVSTAPFTFIDLGCGKGKVMLLASHYPFKKIIGVEFSPELAVTASRNCSRYRSNRQKCKDLSVVCEDVALYRFPPGPLVIYMFNPFREPVMNLVLRELRRSFEADSQELYVIYFVPVLGQLLKRSGFLTPIQEESHFCIFRGNRGNDT